MIPYSCGVTSALLFTPIHPPRKRSESSNRNALLSTPHPTNTIDKTRSLVLCSTPLISTHPSALPHLYEPKRPSFSYLSIHRSLTPSIQPSPPEYSSPIPPLPSTSYSKSHLSMPLQLSLTRIPTLQHPHPHTPALPPIISPHAHTNPSCLHHHHLSRPPYPFLLNAPSNDCVQTITTTSSPLFPSNPTPSLSTTTIIHPPIVPTTTPVSTPNSIPKAKSIIPPIRPIRPKTSR